MHGEGVKLVFDPQYDGEGQPEAYQLYLLNATGHTIIYDLTVRTGSSRRKQHVGRLPKYDKVKLSLVDYQWLNEKLTFDADVRILRLDGTGPRNFQELKIKAKQFFGRYVDVPELHREAYLYELFPRLSVAASTTEEKAPTLRQLTREQLKEKPKKPGDKQLVDNSLVELTEFENELDLHLPALVDNPSSVPRHQILSTQLTFLDRYLDRAVRLGVDRVFIIHGVGNGILKTEVHKRLRYMPYVRQYHNKWNEKYGAGATEVIFD